MLVMDRPWETSLDYVSVVWAEEMQRLVMFYNTMSMCSPTGAPNRTVYICDNNKNPPLSVTLRAESVDGISWSKPPLHTLNYNGTSANNAIQLNQTHGISDSNRGVYRDPFDPDPNQRYKMVGNFFRNTTTTGVLAHWPGYHFGMVSSRDGIHWTGLTDIALQLQARGDTSNNVVYDETSKEWMIFTRIDCHYPPFNTNPSLTNCSQPGYGGQGLRRSARAVSKTWGDNAAWSVAQECSHGVSGEEQYTLNPWRDSSWRPGLWLGLASFYHLSTGSVQSMLMVSSDHGVSWSRVSSTPFIPHGGHGSFDSMGVYAGAPVLDPHNSSRLLVYYEGVDVPHDQSEGHSAIGLAYSPRIPAGYGGGVGSLTTRELEVGDQMWVEGDATAFVGLDIVARGQQQVWRAVLLSPHDATPATSMPMRRTVLEWRRVSADTTADTETQMVPTTCVPKRCKTFADCGPGCGSCYQPEKGLPWCYPSSPALAPLSVLVGTRASFVFVLQNGGIIHSFGFATTNTTR